MRCYTPHWAGMRMGALSDTSHLQYITIQQAGILDYATSEFKPGMRRTVLPDLRKQNILDGKVKVQRTGNTTLEEICD